MSSSTESQYGSFTSLLLGSPIALSAAGLFFVVVFVRYLLNKPKKLDLPVLNGKDFPDCRDVLFEGVTKVSTAYLSLA
jgi:hypothetical protein